MLPARTVVLTAPLSFLTWPVEINRQVLPLGLDLIVQGFDEITHGNQPDQLSLVDHRQLAHLVPRHFAHHFVHNILGATTDGIGGHDLIALSFLKRHRPWFISWSNKALATVPSLSGMVGRFLKPQVRAQHERPGFLTARDHVKRPLRLATC